jgi:hypothetical protein
MVSPKTTQISKSQTLRRQQDIPKYKQINNRQKHNLIKMVSPKTTQISKFQTLRRQQDIARYHHHKHQELGPSIPSVSRVTAALACAYQSCVSFGDSELDRVSSGWITIPLVSKFGGSYHQGLQSCPFSVGVCSISRESQFWGAENTPLSCRLCYNESCIAQGSRAGTWGSRICWQIWLMSCQTVIHKIYGYYLPASIITPRTYTSPWSPYSKI